MRPNLYQIIALCISMPAIQANAIAEMNMEMDMTASNDQQVIDPTETKPSSVDWSTVSATPFPEHNHGVPILDTKLTLEQQKYWNSYNTTTYFTYQSPYQPLVWWHLLSLVLSFAGIYPFVMIFKNLDSNWYLPSLVVQSTLTLVSCFIYSVFISNTPDLYPNMSYSKMITGLVVLTIIQFVTAVICTAKNWLLKNNNNINVANNDDQYNELSLFPEYNDDNNIQELNDLSNSPGSTLYDGDSFDIENNNADEPLKFAGLGLSLSPASPNPLKTSKLVQKRNSILSKLFQNNVIEKLVKSFGLLSTIVFNLLNYLMFIYFLVLLPNGLACLNLFGQGSKVFNLLAHFIKGGVFFSLGLLSLARYCGCYSQMGGAWNYSFITDKERSQSLFLRLQPRNGLILSFEMIESSLILFYGCTNIFLEHLASTDGAWTAKDLQHASIAFMYIGCGLCGVLAEIKLKDWKKSKFFDQVGDIIPANEKNISVSPGFSPNPFPVFTIFWTGLLMSKHSQASPLSTEIHIQWGSLLTYGSFFRVFTMLLMTYYPLKNHKSCFKPSKPLTELVTSFCLLCGGTVFMESTDQVIEALTYRGMTPMFTINVSVGCVSLVMAWIMSVFAIKDWLKSRMK